jgi:hypothetical protein
MFPVTHLLVSALNRESAPVVPPAMRSQRRRRSPLARLRRALAAPTYRWYLRTP